MAKQLPPNPMGLKYKVVVIAQGPDDVEYGYWAARCAVTAAGAVVLEVVQRSGASSGQPWGTVIDKVVLNGPIVHITKEEPTA